MTFPPFYLDEKIFFILNGIGREGLDYVCAWPTFLGDPLVLSAVLLPYMMIWDPHPIGRKYTTLFLGLIAADSAAQFTKHLIYRPRPYQHFLDLVQGGSQQINAFFGLLAQQSSFPSGHTTTFFACAALLNLMYGPRFWFMYVLAAFVGFTRIYVGVHFPSDILAGALLGLFVGHGVFQISRLVPQK
jgi:undecaprenyl-diphosphatase